MANLEFEKPIAELEEKIKELKTFSKNRNVDLSSAIGKLEAKLSKLQNEIFDNLVPWNRVQIARHPLRPYTYDYIQGLMTDFMQLHGDRRFSDDKAMICGFAKFEKHKILVVGHQKGRDTNENLMRNFGCANPEGYRKAMRLMELAEKANTPIVCFIDTPGAYPGIGAEERGQAEAIANNLREMMMLKVPILVYVIGEGGSGGALGIGVGDRICVLENAYYSVISPEGCAAILWKDRKMAPEAAGVLKLTAKDLKELGIIEEIVPEPCGGAHKDVAKMLENMKVSIKNSLEILCNMPVDLLLEKRYEKFRKIGFFKETD